MRLVHRPHAGANDADEPESFTREDALMAYKNVSLARLAVVTLLGFVVTIATSSTVSAQPLPPTVGDPELLRNAELWPPFGTTVWQLPAPHELIWYIAYDPTPLTVDSPEFIVHLVNDGRTVRTLLAKLGASATISFSLTLPNGTTRQSDVTATRAYMYHGREQHIAKGESIANFHLNLFEHVGALDPGVHILQATLSTTAPLRCAQDDAVIVDELSIQLPPMRFEVIAHPVPERDVRGSENIDLEPLTEMDRLTGRIRARLTNIFDVPLSFHADLGLRPRQEPLPEDHALSVYNDIERWTESGWARDGSLGYCGMGTGSVAVEPGKSVSVAFHSPLAHGRSSGVFRCVLTVQTPDGERHKVVTAPIMVEHRNR